MTTMMCVYMYTKCMNLVFPAVKHSLKYFYTASYGVPNFPEFVAAAVVDDIMAAYCDSSIKAVELKQEWMKNFFESNPQHYEMYTGECVAIQPNYFKATIHTLQQRFNQSGGTV